MIIWGDETKATRSAMASAEPREGDRTRGRLASTVKSRGNRDTYDFPTPLSPIRTTWTAKRENRQRVSNCSSTQPGRVRPGRAREGRKEVRCSVAGSLTLNRRSYAELSAMVREREEMDLREAAGRERTGGQLGRPRLSQRGDASSPAQSKRTWLARPHSDSHPTGERSRQHVRCEHL